MIGNSKASLSISSSRSDSGSDLFSHYSGLHSRTVLVPSPNSYKSFTDSYMEIRAVLQTCHHTQREGGRWDKAPYSSHSCIPRLSPALLADTQRQDTPPGQDFMFLHQKTTGDFLQPAASPPGHGQVFIFHVRHVGRLFQNPGRK